MRQSNAPPSLARPSQSIHTYMVTVGWEAGADGLVGHDQQDLADERIVTTHIC